MRKLQLGIKYKLLLAFGLVLATTLIASAIALSAFSRFSSSLGGITDNSVPFMADSMALTQLGMQIGARAPLLSSSKSSAQARSHHAELIDTSGEIEQLLIDMSAGQSASDDELRADNLRDVLQVRTFINDLNRHVEARLESGNKVRQMATSVNHLQLEIDQLLLDSIDSAAFDFVIMTEDVFTENTDLLDTLLDNYVNAIVKLLQLQKLSSELTAVLREALLETGTDQQERASLIADQLQQHDQAFASVWFTGESDWNATVERLVQLTRGENSLFRQDGETPRQLQDDALIRELNGMDATFSRSLSAHADAIHRKILDVGVLLGETVKTD
ncbi:MAG: hypothetical protein HKN42_17575, partial [Granulosicoccus sp.]|nr:hypothetical protein [Granulosicoccus sp.]